MAKRASSTHDVSNPRSDVDPSQLQRMFHYDPSTGRLTRSGRPCGWLHASGYRHVKVGGVTYKEHRVIWAVVTGGWPQGQIDHINGDRSDNRFTNLRDVDGCRNQWNIRGLSKSNRSGFRGVTITADGFQAEIRANGVKHYLGKFKSAEQASAVYEEARARLHAA